MLSEYQVLIDQIKDFSIKVLSVLITLYVIYIIFHFFFNRRKRTINTFIDSFFNYGSYIEMAENINYFKRHVHKKEIYGEIKEAILNRQGKFYELIDSKIDKKNHMYYILCEAKETESKKRVSSLIKLKVTTFGNVKSFEFENRTDEELEYLFKE